MAASSFTNEEYFTKIASIQRSLHEREKRRLELEKELFSYSMSDKRISQIKSAKLRSYLQEICERETRAKMRNLELLRDADSIETRMKEQACDCAPLHRKKAECMNQITRFMTARKNKELKEYGMKEVEGASEKTQDDSSSARRPAAVIFTDHHRASSGGSSATRVHSGRAARGSPDRLAAHSPKRLPSGLLKDSKVSGEEAAAAADRAARLSDDISGSNGSPGSGGCSLSDRHERRRRAPVLLPSACALTDAAAAAYGAVPFRACDDERPLSPPVTLTRPERNISSSGGDTTSPVWAEKSGGGAAAESAGTHDAPHQPQPATEEEERGPSRSGRRESVVSTASSSVLVSSDSDLSISLTESESELDHDDEGEEPTEGVAHLDTQPDARVTSERSASPPERTASPPERTASPPERTAASPPPDDQSLRCREEESSVQESKKPLQFMFDSTTPTESMTERLSHQGLVRLLESIEGRLHDGVGQVHVYQNLPAALHAGKRNHIISLCNSGSAALNVEDLEACGAVVLAELPRLSRSTASGALLTQDLVSVSAARRSDVRHSDISASLPPDGAALWDRWFEHALVLKERRVLTAERLALLFTPLLLERHAACGQQARELLRTLLSRSDEEEEEEEEEEESDSSSPSRRLPSLHPDDKEGTATSRHPWATGGPRATCGPQPHSMRPAELQSSEEDSRNQSPAESIPIRETKAYQLLKQSATQERARRSGEQEEKSAPSGINGGDEEDLHSSHQDPPQPREETTDSKRFSAIQSKAFWGESDDSDSEIEAALRPQTFNTNNDADDFDDFYD